MRRLITQIVHGVTWRSGHPRWYGSWPEIRRQPSLRTQIDRDLLVGVQCAACRAIRSSSIRGSPSFPGPPASAPACFWTGPPGGLPHYAAPNPDQAVKPYGKPAFSRIACLEACPAGDASPAAQVDRPADHDQYGRAAVHREHAAAPQQNSPGNATAPYPARALNLGSLGEAQTSVLAVVTLNPRRRAGC